MREIDTHEEFLEMLKDAGTNLVVVDFHAAWCGPCKIIGPKFEKMQENYPNAVMVKVDVDDNEETAEEYEIESMPHFLFFKNEAQIDEMIGSNAEKLEETIKKNYE
jgi:thioredoxin 1